MYSNNFGNSENESNENLEFQSYDIKISEENINPEFCKFENSDKYKTSNKIFNNNIGSMGYNKKSNSYFGFVPPLRPNSQMFINKKEYVPKELDQIKFNFENDKSQIKIDTLSVKDVAVDNSFISENKISSLELLHDDLKDDVSLEFEPEKVLSNDINCTADFNMDNLSTRRPQSLVDKFPIVSDKKYLNYDYKLKSYKNKSNDIRIINMVEEGLISKIKQIAYYNELILKSYSDEENKILNDIRLDQEKHRKLLIKICENLSPEYKNKNLNIKYDVTDMISDNLKSEYKKCMLEELSLVEFYKRLYFIIECNTIKNFLYEIIIDGLCHGVKLNYCISN